MLDMANPNVNCLVGMACPKCGSFGAFTIAVGQFGLARITDAGMDEFINSTNTEWEADAHCECNDCGHTATVREFRGAPAWTFDRFQQLVIDHYDDGAFKDHKPEDIPECGDGLLKYLLRELSVAEDCRNLDEFLGRLRLSIRQLEAINDAIGPCR